MMNINEMKVVEKLQKTKTPTDTKAVLQMIRKMVIFERLSYEEMLERCVHTEDITSRTDPIYPVFAEDVAAVLESKNEDEQIVCLTEMIMML